jgi:hypothetical protein
MLGNSHGGRDLGVAQQILDHVDTGARAGHLRGEVVADVVQPEILQPRVAPGAQERARDAV